MNTTATSSNGKKPPAVQQTPEELAVAHGIANYQRAVTERDDLQKLVDRQEQMLTVAKIETEGLRAELAAAQSRIASFQGDRDDAVINAAAWQSLFISISAQLRAFEVPAGPHIRQVADHADAASIKNTDPLQY
jgi:hypothetical protein